MRKIRNSLVFTLLLLLMSALINCQNEKQLNKPWKQVDIVIKTLSDVQTTVQKTTLTEEFQKDHIAWLDQNDTLYFADKKEVDINTVKKINLFNHFDDLADMHKAYPNELLNPKTFIGGSIASTLPMNLFQVQNQQITLDIQNSMYSVHQDNKTILTGTMIAFLNPWIFTTQHPINNKDQMWEYTALNTETNQTVPITLPGIIQSIEKIDNHLLLKVVDQVFFNTTQWIFLTEEKKVMMLGSNYAKIHKIGDIPDSDWCIVSDWYNRELSVWKRSTMEKQYTLPLDKYIISSIKAFQDQKKNWHVWIIPVVTVEKFTSNVFYISLRKNRMTIENLDYHEPFYVADSMIDFEGNLFMIEVKPTWNEWYASNQSKREEVVNQSSPIPATIDTNQLKQEINLIKMDPWSRQVTKLPIHWNTDSYQNEKKILFLNPSLEIASDGIIIRNMSDPYYRDYTVEQTSEYIQKIIYFETTIVPKTDEKDFNPFDPVTLQPLSARVPVSDIREALSWDKYKKTGIQNYILIPFESFKQAK